MKQARGVPGVGRSGQQGNPTPRREPAAAVRAPVLPGPSESAVRVVVVRRLTADVEAAVLRLFPQLSSAPPPSTEELEAIVAAPGTALLVAELAAPAASVATSTAGAGNGDTLGSIAGMLTLATFRVPSGVRAWIEDVVVDAEARGRGIGEALTREAVALAAAAGARTVELTSRPSREAANRLYRRVGFELRETNVYRIGT